MAITNIRDFTNDTSVDLYLLNRENPDDTGGSAMKISAHGGVYTHDMWIPWCNPEGTGNQNLFPHHHIAIWDQPDPDRTPVFCIWQDLAIGNSRVRYSTNGRWVRAGDPVHGDSDAGGDRSLVVRQASDGSPVLSLLTFTEPSFSPEPVSFVMTPDGSLNSYGADISDGVLAPVDFRINGVQNVTQGTGSDPWTVTMTLSHRHFSRPCVIPPYGTSHAFDGQPLTGHWQAVLSGENLSTADPRAAVLFYVI